MVGQRRYQEFLRDPESRAHLSICTWWPTRAAARRAIFEFIGGESTSTGCIPRLITNTLRRTGSLPSPVARYRALRLRRLPARDFHPQARLNFQDAPTNALGQRSAPDACRHPDPLGPGNQGSSPHGRSGTARRQQGSFPRWDRSATANATIESFWASWNCFRLKTMALCSCSPG